MEAVILTGGKQYLVKEGDVLEVEKIDASKGKSVTFKEVLLLIDGEEITIGTPFIKKARVKAEVVDQKKGRKVISFKYRRRKSSKRKKGHRQSLTVLKIVEITPA